MVLILVLISTLSSWVPGEWVTAGIVALISWGTLHDLGVPLPLPYRSRQVPEWFRDVLPRSVVAFVFGVQLGPGFLTLFTYSTHLAVLLALPFLGSLEEMLLVVLLFAMGKTLVLGVTLGIQSLEEIRPRFDWSRLGNYVLRSTNALLSALIAVLLILERR